jgi:hypothetical protein
MLRSVNRFIVYLLIVCSVGLGLPLPAPAGIIGTDQLTAGGERDRVKSFLDRDDVRAQLQAQGIDAATAKARVDALTDQEVQLLAGRIDQLPAAGDVIGALLLVFILLLITDILGYTKVFPFTRPIR